MSDEIIASTKSTTKTITAAKIYTKNNLEFGQSLNYGQKSNSFAFADFTVHHNNSTLLRSSEQASRKAGLFGKLHLWFTGSKHLKFKKKVF